MAFNKSWKNKPKIKINPMQNAFGVKIFALSKSNFVISFHMVNRVRVCVSSTYVVRLCVRNDAICSILAVR